MCAMVEKKLGHVYLVRGWRAPLGALPASPVCSRLILLLLSLVLLWCHAPIFLAASFIPPHAPLTTSTSPLLEPLASTTQILQSAVKCTLFSSLDLVWPSSKKQAPGFDSEIWALHQLRLCGVAGFLWRLHTSTCPRVCVSESSRAEANQGRGLCVSVSFTDRPPLVSCSCKNPLNKNSCCFFSLSVYFFFILWKSNYWSNESPKLCWTVLRRAHTHTDDCYRRDQLQARMCVAVRLSQLQRQKAFGGCQDIIDPGLT